VLRVVGDCEGVEEGMLVRECIGARETGDDVTRVGEALGNEEGREEGRLDGASDGVKVVLGTRV